MDRKRGLAYCGLACCLCTSQPDCPGCRDEGCESRGWCKSFHCCRERGYAGCWDCPEFPCGEGMMEKLKPRAFARFVREHGEEALLDCLERNERAGVVYHEPGTVTGEYDSAGDEEGVFSLLLYGRREEREQAGEIRGKKGQGTMREKALELLKQYNGNEALVRHGMAVEAIMRHFAEQAGEDVEYWGCVGLLHDVDYEKYPEEHCKKAVDILREAGYPEDFIHAVVCHGYGLVTDVEPERYLEKVLYTVDELSGLINAAAILRPSHSVMDLEVKSVKKKFKDQRFAAGVDRAVILDGCERLGMELDDVIRECIEGMREHHEELGL